MGTFEKINILVPIDFSDLSLEGLKSAETFAKTFNGRITPIHAYIPVTEMDGPYSVGLGPGANEDYDEIEETLQQRLDETAQEHIDEQYVEKGIIAVGNPAYSIIDTSKDYDMIVMSTHGRTGFSRLILGSVAEKVLRLSHVPVLVVEEESQLEPLQRIMVTTDFSDNSATAFPYAKEIAEKTGAQLDLVHILSYDQFEKNQTSDSVIDLRNQRLDLINKEYFHDIETDFSYEVQVSEDSPHEAIRQHNLDNKYNLIVMATVGRTGLDYLMMGSTTANVVRHVKTAVLSVNPKRKEES